MKMKFKRGQTIIMAFKFIIPFINDYIFQIFLQALLFIDNFFFNIDLSSALMFSVIQRIVVCLNN